MFVLPVWGSLDILEACGASDSGSNPDAGVIYKGSNYMGFAVYVVLSSVVEEAIVAIACNVSKPFYEKYEQMLGQEAGNV